MKEVYAVATGCPVDFSSPSGFGHMNYSLDYNVSVAHSGHLRRTRLESGYKSVVRLLIIMMCSGYFHIF